jgi:NitT/TauT family transport system substrate-binding protein
MIRRWFFVILAAALVLAACAPAPVERVTLRLGLLPIVDSLPMYVAQAQGLFEKEGVAVEFLPVASAAERDQLMQAGQIDGMINDLVSTMFYNKDGRQIVIVRFARTATPEFPTYRLLAGKDSGIVSASDLRNVPIGISEGTVIAYTTDRLLEAEGISPDEIETIAVPKIPDRLALLESGELKAANLPDPLASLAILSGATVILDDTAHPELGNSVIAFRAAVVQEHPEAIRSFLRAVEQGVTAIQADKTAWSSLMSENNLVPAPLLESYVVPDFPTASVPTESQFADALDWTHEKGLVSTDVSYADSVDDGFLPAP